MYSCSQADSVKVSADDDTTPSSLTSRIGVYCGGRLPPAMMSGPDGRLTVTFVSRPRSTGVGFRALYSFVTGLSRANQSVFVRLFILLLLLLMFYFVIVILTDYLHYIFITGRTKCFLQMRCLIITINANHHSESCKYNVLDKISNHCFIWDTKHVKHVFSGI